MRIGIGTGHRAVVDALGYAMKNDAVVVARTAVLNVRALVDVFIHKDIAVVVLVVALGIAVGLFDALVFAGHAVFIDVVEAFVALRTHALALLAGIDSR